MKTITSQLLDSESLYRHTLREFQALLVFVFAAKPISSSGDQLDESRNGAPLLRPGDVAQAPNPNQGHESIQPQPGSGGP